MNRRIALWLFGMVTTLVLLLVGGVALVAGTESGTRWLLGIASESMPGDIAIGSSDGSLLSGVQLREVKWQDEPVQLSVERLFVDVDLFPLLSRRVAVRRLDIQGPNLVLGPDGGTESHNSDIDIDLPFAVSIDAASISDARFRNDTVDRQIVRIDLAGHLDGPSLKIARLDFRSDWLDADLSGRVTLRGDLPLRLRLAWQRTLPDEPELRGHLQLRGNARELDLQHTLVSPIAVTTEGSLRFEPDDVYLDLTNRWESAEWPIDDHRLYSAMGAMRLTGTPAGFHLSLDAVAQLDELPETRIALVGDADLESIRIQRFDLDTEVGRLLITGNAAWAPTPSIDIEFDVTELNPALASATLDGELGARGSASATLADSGLQLEARIDAIEGAINGLPAGGESDLTYGAVGLEFGATHIHLGSNSISADGTVGDTLDIEASFDFPAITELVADASGALRGRLLLSGPLEQPEFSIDVTGERLAYGSNGLEGLHASLSGNAATHSLNAALKGYGQEVVVAAAGGLVNDQWKGRLSSLEISGEALGHWASQQPVEISVSTTTLTLPRFCLSAMSGPGRACASINYRDQTLVGFDASLEEYPLAALPIPLSTDVQMTGVINAATRGQLIDQRLSASGTVGLSNAAVTATYAGEQTSLDLSRAAGTFDIADNRLHAALNIALGEDVGNLGAEFTLADIMDPGSAMDGEASLLFPDTSFFAIFLPSIHNPHGRLEGDLTLDGTTIKPEILGQIALGDGGFSIPSAGIGVSDVNIQLQQLSPGRLQLLGSARSGDGIVSIEGHATVSTSEGIRTEILISGTDFELLRLPDLQVAASPSISVVLDDHAAIVRGELGIPRADIKVKTVPESAQEPSPDVTVHRSESSEEPPPARRVDIRVTTLLGDNVQLAGFGLTTKIDGAIQLRGSSQQAYLGFGRLDLRGGRYESYGQDLTIERGSLIFNGPLDDPELDIRATRQAGDVTAGIQLSGTPSQLQSEVFSEPPMSDAETLSYLLTGRPLSSATTAGEGDALNDAAFALGVSGAGAIVSQIGGALGLETLTLEGDADSSRVVAGKQLGSRLFVEYGYGLIDRLGTLILRYQLNERIVLESRTGTVSNLDIVYSVKRK